MFQTTNALDKTKLFHRETQERHIEVSSIIINKINLVKEKMSFHFAFGGNKSGNE
jgi:hypothetical protein